MCDFNVSKDMKKMPSTSANENPLNRKVGCHPKNHKSNEIHASQKREVAVGKVATHSCLTLIVKELKISVEQGRVVTTLNIIKHEISYLV